MQSSNGLTDVLRDWRGRARVGCGTCRRRLGGESEAPLPLDGRPQLIKTMVPSPVAFFSAHRSHCVHHHHGDDLRGGRGRYLLVHSKKSAHDGYAAAADAATYGASGSSGSSDGRRNHLRVPVPSTSHAGCSDVTGHALPSPTRLLPAAGSTLPTGGLVRRTQHSACTAAVHHTHALAVSATGATTALRIPSELPALKSFPKSQQTYTSLPEGLRSDISFFTKTTPKLRESKGGGSGALHSGTHLLS